MEDKGSRSGTKYGISLTQKTGSFLQNGGWFMLKQN
jgi:hypothetical protein